MSNWFQPLELADVQRASSGRADRATRLDIQFTEVDPDYLRASMPVDERTQHAFGVLHGATGKLTCVSHLTLAIIDVASADARRRAVATAVGA